MKYFILLAALISVSESGCPSMCNCSDAAVFCVEKHLESVPSFESLLNDPVIIDLSGNKINMIDADDFSFDKSDKVKEVYLNNTELLDMDNTAFDELENLQELYLGENLLNSIPEDLIEDLPNMILLDLSNNHFSGDMPRLKSKSLEVLAVANSKITSLPIDSLKYLPNLKMLLLQQNNIKSIDPRVFENVNKNSFFVRLSYNVWDCSCDNIRLFEYLAERQFIDTSDPYQCLTSTGTYVNVYRDKNMEYLKSKCLNKNQITKDLSAFKENHFIIEAEGLLKDDDYSSEVEDSDTPYSLVIEHNNTFIDEDSSEVQFPDHEILDNYSDEEYADILVSRNKETEEDFEKYEEYDAPFSMGFNYISFFVISCSFIVGVLFGFCLNQLATMLRHKNLETSDSRTKLILP